MRRSRPPPGQQAGSPCRPLKVSLGHQVGGGRHWFEGRVVPGCPVPDDLVMGRVRAGSSPWHPGHGGGVHLLERGEGPAGQDMVTDDEDLPFDAAFPGGTVGGERVTRGLAEAPRLGTAMGADTLTLAGLAGLAGMGDLVATYSSTLSRNHTFGAHLGRGLSIEEARSQTKQTAEGVASCKVISDLGQRHQVELPVTETVGRHHPQRPEPLGRRAGSDVARHQTRAWGRVTPSGLVSRQHLDGQARRRLGSRAAASAASPLAARSG